MRDFMRRLTLLAGTAAAVLLTTQAGALAQTAGCVIISGIEYCDPAAFHVTGPGAGATADPVIIQSSTEVSIFKNSGGAAINPPLNVFFAVPVGKAAPTLTGAFFNGAASTDTFTPITQLPGTFSSGDLYSFVGCIACDNSENFGNFLSGLALAGLPTTTGFDVYTTTISRGFPLKDDTERLVGTFAAGTYVVPLASNVGTNKTTFFDAAFTETGLMDGPPVIKTPEPMSLALLGMGVLGLGAVHRRRR